MKLLRGTRPVKQNIVFGLDSQIGQVSDESNSFFHIWILLSLVLNYWARLSSLRVLRKALEVDVCPPITDKRTHALLRRVNEARETYSVKTESRQNSRIEPINSNWANRSSWRIKNRNVRNNRNKIERSWEYLNLDFGHDRKLISCWSVAL